MGLLDDVMGAAMGGGKDNPLGGLLGSLGGGGGNPLGDLLGQVVGGDTAKSAGLMAGLMALVQQMGGFEALLQKFQQKGLGQLAQSWLSTGSNLPLGAAQLQQVFGSDAIAGLAKQAGMNTQQASDAIGKLLPELVNQFSPQGALPGNHADLLKQGLEMFSRGLR